MLVLKRRDDDWVTITHKSGDTIRVRTCEMKGGRGYLVFDDGPRNFTIERCERSQAPLQG